MAIFGLRWGKDEGAEAIRLVTCNLKIQKEKRLIMQAKDKIIVALDVSDLSTAIRLVNQLKDEVSVFKIGLEFIYSLLVQLVFGSSETLTLAKEFFELTRSRLFWDGKLSDIPNTVRKAVEALFDFEPAMINVHANCGRKSIEAAVASLGNSLLLGVTVLTSIDQEECQSIFGDKPGPKVVQFGFMLKNAGAQGIICSPQELSLLANYSALSGLLKITPGVRPLWAAKGDQKRVMTPREAIEAGADYLVIGRPITEYPEKDGGPVAGARRIVEEIETGMEEREVKS
ncbi:MAG: orotidine-5'-phosphate decarboxylase [Patescibacteria group bacterium]